MPVGNERAQVGDSFVNPQVQTSTTTNTTLDCSNPFFAGHNLLIEQDTAVTVNRTLTQDHVRRFEAAMKGFDAEVGRSVPYCPYVRAYAGGYNFETSGSPQAWGVKGRLEACIHDNVVLDLSVQNDRVFNTTVTFGGGITWGGLCHRRHAGCCVASDRLGDRVERNYDIVVTQQTTHEAVSSLLSSNTTTTATPVAAFDPATGQVLFFDHADSNAAAGGNGTFEHPFNNLAALQAGSKPGDVLYAHGGSVFDGAINPLNQGFTLQDNQRFLGEMAGCPHTVNTQCGVVVIPGVNPTGAAPIIDNSNGNSITLANNNEVSGFNITPSGPASTTTHGIFGQGITNFNINCNTIGMSSFGEAEAKGVRPAQPGPGSSSIFLQDTQGTGLITMNTLHAESFSNSTDADAIHIENGTVANVAPLNVTIFGNTIVGAGNSGNGAFDSGVFISTANNARVTATISGNTINNAATNRGSNAGIDITTADTSVVTATISGNTISGVLGDGIDLNANDASQLTVQASGNTITGNGGNGVLLFNVAATFSGNTIAGNHFDGLDAFGCTGTFSGNTISGNGAFGVIIFDGTTVFSGNTIHGNTENGFFVEAGGSMQASIVNNMITNNGLVFGTNAGGIHSQVDNPGLTQYLSITGNTFSGNTTQAVEVFGGTGGGPATVGLRLTANTSDGNYTLDNVTNGTGLFDVEEWGGPAMHNTLLNSGAGTVIYNPANMSTFTFVPPNSLPFSP